MLSDDIHDKLDQLRLKHWSTYIAFAIWGTAGYGFTPSIGSFVTHFGIMPPLLALLVWRSRHQTTGGRMIEFKTAEQLRITEERHAALVKTLDLMEAGKIIHIDSENLNHMTGESETYTGHFNMAVWNATQDCGTAACIGGTAELVGNVKFSGPDIPSDLEDLFYDYSGDPTVAQGAAALRNYLTHGLASWDLVMGQ